VTKKRTVKFTEESPVVASTSAKTDCTSSKKWNADSSFKNFTDSRYF
jgi:hypothetical protein